MRTAGSAVPVGAWTADTPFELHGSRTLQAESIVTVSIVAWLMAK